VIALFLSDDLSKRHAYRAVLSGKPPAHRSPAPTRRSIRVQMLANFILTGGAFGALTGTTEHKSVASALLSGLVFGGLMTYGFERIRRRDLARGDTTKEHESEAS